MCPLSANTFKIEFVSFVIRDYDTKRVVFKVDRENPSAAVAVGDFSDTDEDSYRRISYDFSVDVLRLSRIPQCMWDICCSVSVVMFCFSLQFVVGDNEVENFRMIERHYFRDRVLFLR